MKSALTLLIAGLICSFAANVFLMYGRKKFEVLEKRKPRSLLLIGIVLVLFTFILIYVINNPLKFPEVPSLFTWNIDFTFSKYFFQPASVLIMILLVIFWYKSHSSWCEFQGQIIAVTISLITLKAFLFSKVKSAKYPDASVILRIVFLIEPKLSDC